jgi:hypothetical protein
MCILATGAPDGRLGGHTRVARCLDLGSYGEWSAGRAVADALRVVELPTDV